MRALFGTIVLMACAAACCAAPLDRVSLRLHGGAGWPALESSAAGPRPASGSSVGAEVGYAVSPAVRLTAAFARDRYAVSNDLVAIPELRSLGSEPFGLVTTLVGFDARMTPVRRSPIALHAGIAGGAAWLREGARRFQLMGASRSFSEGGARGSHPAVAASLGMTLPTGLSFADLDLGWRELWMDASNGALRIGAFQGGVLLHR